MFVNGKWLDGRLDDVLYILSLRKNFSIDVCTSKDYVLKFESNNVKKFIACFHNDLWNQTKYLFRLLIKVVVNETNVAAVDSVRNMARRA